MCVLNAVGPYCIVFLTAVMLRLPKKHRNIQGVPEKNAKSK